MSSCKWAGIQVESKLNPYAAGHFVHPHQPSPPPLQTEPYQLEMMFQPVINQTTSLTMDTNHLKPISQTVGSLLVPIS
jgi:hypothetical protein